MRNVQEQTVAVAGAVGSAIVSRFLSHIDQRAIARKLRQASNWIPVADVRRIVADQVTDDAHIKRFGGRYQAQSVIRILIKLKMVVRVCVARIPTGSLQIPEYRNAEISNMRV